VEEGGKRPLITNFPERATSDPAQITAWWKDIFTGEVFNHNIGVLTTNLIVVDIDEKNGKNGIAGYASINGHYDTLTISSPNGGYHCYFYGDRVVSSTVDLAGISGVDIRGHNSIVHGPGSEINGKKYEVVVDKPIARIPETIDRLLREPRPKREVPSNYTDIDSDSAIEQATDWIKNHAPLAVEGAGGDSTTYQVSAALVRDYAISVETATEIMLDHWNDRCAPPWGADELRRKIENADNYAVGEIGHGLAESYFAHAKIPDYPTGEHNKNVLGTEAEQSANIMAFGNALPLSAIPKRPWLMTGFLIRGYTTLLPAAGSSGKSILSLTIAAHLALGKNFGNYKTLEAVKSIVYNAEDDLNEQSRRLHALCAAYQFPYEKVRDSIMLLSNETAPLTLVEKKNKVVCVNKRDMDGLIGLADKPDIGMICIDPLVEVHECDEQDNAQMRTVMATFRQIARRANVAMLLPHHTSKPPQGATQSRAGNADVSRGASAIVNSARVVVTLFAATDQDCQKYGITDSESGSLVRLDEAKANLTLASSESTWLKKIGVKLHNGDEVGALMPQEMKGREEASRQAMADIIVSAMKVNNTASMPFKTVIPLLKIANPLYAKQTSAQLKSTVEQTIGEGVEMEDGCSVRVCRESSTPVLVLG
jgi:RecA-family ATPase